MLFHFSTIAYVNNPEEVFRKGAGGKLSYTIFVGLSALADEAYGFTLVRPCVCVCPSQHNWRSAHQIFPKLCTKLLLGETKKMFQADF